MEGAGCCGWQPSHAALPLCRAGRSTPSVLAVNSRQINHLQRATRVTHYRQPTVAPVSYFPLVCPRFPLSQPPNSPIAAVRHLTVDEESAGQRLDNFLIRELKGVPKTHIYRIIRSGEVRRNKGRVGPMTGFRPVMCCAFRRFACPNAQKKTTESSSGAPISGDLRRRSILGH